MEVVKKWSWQLMPSAIFSLLWSSFMTKLLHSKGALATLTVKEGVGVPDGAEMTGRQLVSCGCGFYMRTLLRAWASLLQSPFDYRAHNHMHPHTGGLPVRDKLRFFLQQMRANKTMAVNTSPDHRPAGSIHWHSDNIGRTQRVNTSPQKHLQCALSHGFKIKPDLTLISVPEHKHRLRCGELVKMVKTTKNINCSCHCISLMSSKRAATFKRKYI